MGEKKCKCRFNLQLASVVKSCCLKSWFCIYTGRKINRGLEVIAHFLAAQLLPVANRGEGEEAHFAIFLLFPPKKRVRLLTDMLLKESVGQWLSRSSGCSVQLSEIWFLRVTAVSYLRVLSNINNEMESVIEGLVNYGQAVSQHNCSLMAL